MRKWICLALAAMLILPALAGEAETDEYEVYDEAADAEEFEDYEEEEEPVELGSGQKLEMDEVYYLDLDGDGTEEIVRAKMMENDEDENLSLLVETDELIYNYDSYVISDEAAYAADLDGDGRMEILLSGDEASYDYFTWCLKFSREEGLQPIPFADANRGENTDEYFDSGYGRVAAIDGNQLTLVGSQDALGTWMCSRQFTLRDGRFELDDGGVWNVAENFDDPEIWEYRSLNVTKELPVTLEDGAESTLPVGTRFLITSTDKQSFVTYQTQQGDRGKISITPNTEEGWGFLIDGASEYDYFEFVPYAD